MKTKILFLFIISAFAFGLLLLIYKLNAGSFPQVAGETYTQYKGYILLDQGDINKAWYITPASNARYFLGSKEKAFAVMKSLAVNFSGTALQNPMAASWSGLFLKTKDSGPFYYVYPGNLKYYGISNEDEFYRLVQDFGIKVDTSTLIKIPLPSAQVKVSQPTTSTTSYTQKQIQTKSGTFLIDLAIIDLNYHKIMSATAAASDCKNNCPAAPLKDYVLSRGGFAGINGAYFCPPDYTSCQSKVNYYFFPFYDTQRGNLTNTIEFKWLQGATLVFDQNQKAYFFPDGRDFKSKNDFEERYNTKVQALISNNPALIYQGKNIVSSQKMDDKQKNTRGYRSAIGLKGSLVYLVVARSATVPNLADIMQALGVDTALNLDGGGSTALYWQGQYKVGPGRKLPTAIIFK